MFLHPPGVKPSELPFPKEEGLRMKEFYPASSNAALSFKSFVDHENHPGD
jgi:hypothetical protein